MDKWDEPWTTVPPDKSEETAYEDYCKVCIDKFREPLTFEEWLAMPWETTGKKPGKRPHTPYKVAMTLLYGVGIPGVRRMGGGQFICTINPLSQAIRLTGRQIKDCMRLLAEWGVVSELSIERTYFVARFNEPKGFDTEGNWGQL